MIDRLLANRFLRFALVGGGATLLQYGLLIVLIELQLMAKVAASAVSFALSAAANYWLNYRFTFASKQRHAQTLPKFIITAAIGLAVNTLSFGLLLLVVPHYLIAQLTATAITLVCNFLLHKHWIYRSSYDYNNANSDAVPSDSRPLLQRRGRLHKNTD